ncbi:MAG TPA: hypothetical protein VFZ69_10355 [Longimicrobiales bacterium]
MSDRTTTAVALPDVQRRAVMLRLAVALTATLLLFIAARPASGQDWRTTSYSRQLSGEDRLVVDVEYGAGELRIAPAGAGTLYRTNLRYDANTFTPRFAYDNGRMRFGMEGNSVRGRNIEKGLLDVRLSPDVPLDIDLAFGATDATIDLSGLRVRRAELQTGASRTMLTVTRPNPISCELFEIEVGAAKFEARGLGNLNARRFTLEGGVGEVTLDFTGTWAQSLQADIEMGLGSLTLRFPEGLGVRITKEGLLASFDSQRLTKRGDVYYSENWDRASYKLSLDLNAALGSIRVEWVDS